jgi:hypothetical protein
VGIGVVVVEIVLHRLYYLPRSLGASWAVKIGDRDSIHPALEGGKVASHLCQATWSGAGRVEPGGLGHLAVTRWNDKRSVTT